VGPDQALTVRPADGFTVTISPPVSKLRVSRYSSRKSITYKSPPRSRLQQLGAFVSLQAVATAHANKALVRRLVEEVWNRTNLGCCAAIIAPDFSRHGQVLGPAGVQAIIARLSANWPDLHYTIEDMVAEGDRVVIRSTVRMTSTGAPVQSPLFGRITLPAGTVVAISGINIFRIADGKVAETWELSDLASAARQLGINLQDSRASV
jgi:predicted ester cyclase